MLKLVKISSQAKRRVLGEKTFLECVVFRLGQQGPDGVPTGQTSPYKIEYFSRMCCLGLASRAPMWSPHAKRHVLEEKTF